MFVSDGRIHCGVFLWYFFFFTGSCALLKLFIRSCLHVTLPGDFRRGPSSSEERGLSRKHIIESVKGSLERLQLDYIDVVLIHRADPMCPMEGRIKTLARFPGRIALRVRAGSFASRCFNLSRAEVVRAMSHVIDHGWAMYWGTSRWSAVEISEAYNNCRQFNCPLPICEQAEYHFLCREKVEISLPEVYNKLGSPYAFLFSSVTTFEMARGRPHDMVAAHHGIQRHGEQGRGVVRQLPPDVVQGKTLTTERERSFC